jgi:hypothetical protein
MPEESIGECVTRAAVWLVVAGVIELDGTQGFHRLLVVNHEVDALLDDSIARSLRSRAPFDGE